VQQLRRLQTKLFLIVLVAMLPALGFQAYTEFEARRTRQQLVQEEALRLVRLVASEQQRIVEGAEQVLNVIASAPAVQDNDPEQCRRMLANLLKQARRYSSTGVIGLDGRVRCAPVPFDPDLEVSGRDFFARAIQTGGFVISGYAVGLVSRRPAIHMAKPFRDAAGNLGGVVVVSLDLDWLGEQLHRLPLPPGATALISDRDGIMLARYPEGARFVGQPMPAQNHFLLEGDKVAIASVMSLDGRPDMKAYSPPGAEPKGLFVGVGLDRDLSFAEVTQANLIGSMLIFAGLALALATTYLLGGRLLGRPVRRLLAAAARWRIGDLAARTGLAEDSGEFGQLGIAFDAMAAALAERERTLRENEAVLRTLTDTLEMRVREEIAARETAQARAAQAERMQALGQLAGGIAHDFNNVLQAVGGAASLIERRPGDEAGVRRLARIAMEAAGRGSSVTRRLLAFGRRGDLRAEPLDASALLHGLREIFVHTLGAGIEIDVSAEAGLPLVLADKGQLETALVNLATNARDAMPEGGQLVLAAETEFVSAAGAAHPAGLAPGRYVRFTVTDTGTGMDAATLARAGQPFFTTKPMGVGTGLGLPMAKGFADQSGGALSIRSTPGEGTVVELWLPEAGAALIPCSRGALSAAASPAASARAAGRPVRVLVVDDEAMIRDVLSGQLADGGYEVVTAADGASAIALIEDGEAVDVLVTDLSMPGMNGLAVIRGAQERRPGLPAILLTGYAGDGTALAMSGSVKGAFLLLRKPIPAQDLVDRIQAVLEVGACPETAA
jgi:signal transduction histidine kinase/ActR/RegA family two-component response regulator